MELKVVLQNIKKRTMNHFHTFDDVVFTDEYSAQLFQNRKVTSERSGKQGSCVNGQSTQARSILNYLKSSATGSSTISKRCYAAGVPCT